ncbi:hypothetical protein [Lapidilactobacillus bayanensis]|uniref:hypothetical protein n=1 Tax=Lapidilactobacillus bayanensis TaxID=2485998 RepID=UPI000F76F380|nr:hypothetical protein [Lapidilactobacillus bayanensis]
MATMQDENFGYFINRLKESLNSKNCQILYYSAATLTIQISFVDLAAYTKTTSEYRDHLRSISFNVSYDLEDGDWEAEAERILSKIQAKLQPELAATDTLDYYLVNRHSRALVRSVRQRLVTENCQVVTASSEAMSIQVNFVNLPADVAQIHQRVGVGKPFVFSVPFNLAAADLEMLTAQVIEQIRTRLQAELFTNDSIDHYIRPIITKNVNQNRSQISVKNLPINLVLALYTFLLAVAVPIIFLSAILIGGEWFNIPLYSLLGAGVIGAVLAIISLISSRKHNLRTTGSILALIGTIMISTGVLMTLFFIITPLLLVADRLLLRPKQRDELEPVATTSLQPQEKITGIKDGYEVEKKQLNALMTGGNPTLPFGFYFNTDSILKLIPIVGFTTIGVYLFIWFTTRSSAQPGTTAPMFISLGLVMVLFVMIDVLVWLIWKWVARPIVVLDHSGIYYRKQRQQFFVAWADIVKFANVLVPSGQTEAACLLVFAKDPAKYLNTRLLPARGKEQVARWWHGIRPEYFQNEFAGVVLMIPIDRLGINRQTFLNLITDTWQKNAATVNHDVD